jgi:hypothetical protein
VRSSALILGLGLTVACAAEEEERHYVRAVVGTNLVAGSEIDAFSIVVVHDSKEKLNKTYELEAVERLPDSLILLEDNPRWTSDYWTVPVLRISVTGRSGGVPVVWRSAAFRFSNGQWQLPLALCHDCLHLACDDKQTCTHGKCEGDGVSPPADSDEQTDPAALCGLR